MNYSILIGSVLVALLFVVFLERAMRWWIDRGTEKTLKDIREGRVAAVIHPVTITWDANGFSLNGANADPSAASLRWEEVTRVTAYKHDLFISDQICLLFERRAKVNVEISAETNGWLPFVESLPTFLPGCRALEKWIWAVATPAFAQNMTEIFVRPSTQLGKEVSA